MRPPSSTTVCIGGPALVKIDDQLGCLVEVINTAPFDIQLEQGKFFEAIELLDSDTMEIQTVNQTQLANLFSISQFSL